MKNLLLSVALIATPVGIFTFGYNLLSAVQATAQTAATAPSLGDMSAFATIITDVQKRASAGDLPSAATRITDFETAWDDAEPTMRPLNAEAWGNVDAAADHALKALRAGHPDTAKVTKTLADLQSAFANPSGASDGAAIGGAAKVGGIATTDANGHALPCEDMLKEVSTRLQSTKLPGDQQTKVTDLQSKALERCNADDDTRADDFSAQAIALLTASN